MRWIRRGCQMLATAGVVVTTACSSELITTPGAPESAAAARRVGWRQLLPAGSGPVGLNAAAAAPGLQVIFAGQMPDYQAGSLWRLELRTDSWTQLPATNWPIGKYRNLVYDAPNKRLLTYWDGLGQVYSIPETGGAWVAEGSAPNLDDYYEGYSFFNPVSRRLTVFAGYGFGTWKDLLWEWDGAGNQWLAPVQSSPHPDPRFGHGPSSVAVDAAGKRAFLGQRSLGATPGGADDLWMLDLRSNSWRNLIAPTTGARARLGSALAYASRTKTLYRFGGCVLSTGCATFSNELLSMKLVGATLAWSRIATTGSLPAARDQSGLFYDSARNRLILISGSDGTAYQDDVWSYNLP